MSNVFLGKPQSLSDLTVPEFEKLKETWFRSYKRECKEVPYKAFDYLNKYIDQLCKEEKTKFMFFYRDKEQIGWCVVRQHSLSEDSKGIIIQYLQYLWLNDTVTDGEYNKLRFVENKIYVTFMNKYVKRMFGRDAINFPWFWVRILQLERLCTHFEALLKKKDEALRLKDSNKSGLILPT